MDENLQRLVAKYDFSFDVIELLWQKYGPRAEEMIQALKRPVAKFAIRVNTLKITAKKVQEILEHTVNVAAEQHPFLEEALFLPVQGPFSIPLYKERIVVDKFAGESLMQGSDLFAPGIRKVGKVKIGDEVTIIDKKGEVLAAGIAQMTGKDMLQFRKGLAVKITNSIYKIMSIHESELFEKGYVFDQSFPSIVVSRVLDPKPDELILDMCTAPGGKATHIAQLMQNKGKIVAVDRSLQRLRHLESHIQRLGISNVEILGGDSRNLPDKYYQWADKVLIDPPCSALGVRPKLWDSTTKKEIADSVKYQRQFLNAAMNYIRPNGIIVYCTCTLTTEENEENIKYVCENFGCRIIDQPVFLGSPGEKIEGLENWQKLQRFYPDQHETPGYFIAKLQVKP
jgi:NOL1/NOP2/sun family putative RNA methylase